MTTSKGGPPVTEPCGTLAAYRRHLRRGEKPCPACLERNRQATADRRAAGEGPGGDPFGGFAPHPGDKP